MERIKIAIAQTEIMILVQISRIMEKNKAPLDKSKSITYGGITYTGKNLSKKVLYGGNMEFKKEFILREKQTWMSFWLCLGKMRLYRSKLLELDFVLQGLALFLLNFLYINRRKRLWDIIVYKKFI